MFSTCTISISFGVTSFFWILTIFVDPELVHPKEISDLIPIWYNQTVHTNVSVFMILEMIWTYHKYPSNFTCVFWMGVYMNGYVAWIIFLKYYTGAWVYPILHGMNLWQLIVFFLIVFIIGWVVNLLLKFVNSKMWKKRVDKVEMTNEERHNYFKNM